jgi:hypothetical protein
MFGEKHALWQSNGEAVDECGLGSIRLGHAAQQPRVALGNTTSWDWMRELFKNRLL